MLLLLWLIEDPSLDPKLLSLQCPSVSWFPFVLQGSSPSAGPASQLLRQADGSMQAVPRIIIRTTTPPTTLAAPTPLQHSPPSQQAGYPVVLNSRVVRDPTPDPPTSAGLPHSYAHWAAPEQQQQRQHRRPHSQYGMHQYQEQQPPSTAHAQQPLGQSPHVSLAQHQPEPPQQLQYVAQQPLQQLPQQGQLQGQQLPRPGSFQELLSAPLLPSSAIHEPASRHTPAAATRAKPAPQAPLAQPAAVYASQVVGQPPSTAVDTAQLALNPGLVTMAPSQHMFLQQRGNPSLHQQQQQQQQQHHQLGASPYAATDETSSSQLRMQTSSAMYPPIQYPQPVGAFPVLPKTSTGPVGPGHPYHGYHASQAAGSVTPPLQLEQQPQLLTHQQQPHHQQQQQQQQQHAFQPYLQAQPGLGSLPTQSAGHQYQQQQQQSGMHHGATAPAAGFASPAHQQMAQVRIGNVTYDPPQRLGQPPGPTSNPLAALQAQPGVQFYPSQLISFQYGSQHSDHISQQSHPPSLHAHGAQNPSVTDTRDMCYPSQHGADAATARGKGSGGVPWGSVQGGVPDPAYAPTEQARGPSPAGSAGGSANQQQMSGLLLLLLQVYRHLLLQCLHCL